MSSQYRSAKVFSAAAISVIIGAVILKTLGSSPPSAGAFSLSDYYRLEPIEEVISSRHAQLSWRWNRIKIDYSGPKTHNIDQPAPPNAVSISEDVDYHFVVCNGLAGNDGQIQSTEIWQRQLSIPHSQTWGGSEKTIRICIIADGKIVRPTDFQIKRAEALVEALSRKFNIRSSSINYTESW